MEIFKRNLNASEWCLLATLLILYCAFEHMPGYNDMSRFALTMSIVHEGALNIDKYEEFTDDKAFCDGHYYCDKAPGLSFLAIPVYTLSDQVTPFLASHTGSWGPAANLENEDAITVKTFYFKRWITRFFTVASLSAIFSILFFRYLLFRGVSLSLSVILTLAYSMGTLAFPYSTVFYGHQSSAILLFSAFIFIDVALNTSKGDKLCLFIAGLLAGLAVLVEYPVLLIVLILGIFFVFSKWREARLSGKAPYSILGAPIFYILGGLGPALLLVIYNAICFGSPWSLSYDFVAGTGFIKGMSEGYSGVSFPNISALWGITFSPYRGLFFICPFLVLFFPAAYDIWRKRKSLKASFGAFVTAFSIVVAYLLFNASYHFWNGGWAIGPRHFIPALPFLVFIISGIPGKYKGVLIVLTIVSFLNMFVSAAVNPQVPESIACPLFNYCYPQFFSGNLSSITLMSVLGVEGIWKTLPFLFVAFIGAILFGRLANKGQNQRDSSLLEKK